MLTKSEGMKAKLCPFSLGIALGVTEGLFMMFFAWAGHFWHYGTPIIHEIASVYYGYASTIVGGFYGAIWGLIDGFIFGLVVGWIYNFCICQCCSKRDLS